LLLVKVRIFVFLSRSNLAYASVSLSCFDVSLLKQLELFGSIPIKLFQIGSDQIRIKLDQIDYLVKIGSNPIKSDQIGSNWIKSSQNGSNRILLPNFGGGAWPPPLSFVFDYWETWLMLVMLEHVQACFF
jgi:hypothetical protein